MVINITLPESAEQELHQAFGPAIDRTALEALAIEGYRTGKLSLAQIGRLMGLDSRWAVEEWLGDRGVTWNYSPEDLEADRRTVQRLFGDEI